jgi:hypothetical protein
MTSTPEVVGKHRKPHHHLADPFFEAKLNAKYAATAILAQIIFPNLLSR